MFGMTFGMITCAAIVRSIETSSTKITYLLEDHTGRIEAHYWLEEGDSLKAPDVMINNYAKIYGSVRSQGPKKTIMVFKMLAISDPNEVCTHILEVLNARFKSEEYSKGMAGGGDYGQSSSKEFGLPTSGSASMASNMGLNPKQMAVFEAIKNHVSEEGISRQELRKKFSHIMEAELK